ncbi:MAG: RhuM family protein [Bacteroidota bacterium]
MAADKNTDVLVFESKDGSARLEVTTDYDTVWVSKEQMSELFQRDRSVISRHVNNIFKEEEVERETNVQKMHISTADRPVEFFSLDVVISVGYRVKSKRGVEFRQWATKILKQYVIDGYALNSSRLANAPGSLLDLFKMQVQLWEEQQTINSGFKSEIKELGQKILEMESKIKSVDEGYYTIAGYCNLNKIACPIHKAKEWGKKATKQSRLQKFPTGTAHDERFGRVRTYHQDILREVIK